jgi:hypothetical protein
MPREEENASKPSDSKNETLLKEMRDNFSYFSEAWQSIREKARKDMLYVAGDPWDSNEREFRVKHDRPVMTWDELSPYINQLVNDPRQNKRAIEISPRGSGATNVTAQLREDKIREIQYNSRAQSAFTTAFQGAAERSYGYFGINSRLVANNLTEEEYERLRTESPEKLYEQELYIYRIPNPDTVLFNPNYKEQDCSDSDECFVEDKLNRSYFKQKYPNAKFGDWNADMQQQVAPGWGTEKEVRVCARYKVIIKRRKLLLLNTEKKGDMVAMYEDELAPDQKGVDKWMADEKNRKRILRDRYIETRSVKQWMTNGLEILEECPPIPIPWIPIIPVFGKEVWVDRGGGPKREIFSLVRLARDPMMFYAYIRSQEAEEFGMTPRAPLIGYVGQFETDRATWENLNKMPTAFAQVDPVVDPTNPNQLLPLPTRQPFVPNAQAYEIAAEAARRAIRTACGGSDLPTSAQRMNEKSGVALKEIEANEDRGTFHFIDNYNYSLEHAGRIIDAWFPYVYDTKREISIEKADGEKKSITINDEEFTEKDATGQAVKTHYDAVTGDHGVTVGTGKDFASQREEIRDLLGNIMGELQQIAAIAPPGAAAKLLALSIRLGNYGHLGEEMADTLDPPDSEKQKQQQFAGMQQQLQQTQQVIVELQSENQKLKLERAGKVIDNQFKAARESAQAASDEKLAQLDRDIQVLKALLASKQNISDQEYETFRTVWVENHGAAHEAATQAVEHQHEKQQAATALATAQAQAAGEQNNGNAGDNGASGSPTTQGS